MLLSFCSASCNIVSCQIPTAIDVIQQKFGSLKPSVDAPKLMRESGEFPDVSMKTVSRHFPPVVHQWSTRPDTTTQYIPEALVAPVLPSKPEYVESGIGIDFPKPRIFQHELMQTFSFHLFAKRPVEPITTMAALRRELMRKIALSALQIRFVYIYVHGAELKGSYVSLCLFHPTIVNYEFKFESIRRYHVISRTLSHLPRP